MCQRNCPDLKKKKKKNEEEASIGCVRKTPHSKKEEASMGCVRCELSCWDIIIVHG